MPDDLYFIPILARALKQPRTRAALREAFVEIERLGREPGYERGLAQFHRFMVTARDAERHADELHHLIKQDLVIEAAFGMSPGGEEQRRISLELIRSTDAWPEYEQLRAELARSEASPSRSDLRLVRGTQVVGAVELVAAGPTASIANVGPGSYELILGTGRLLWEGELTAADCIWSAAFPGAPLALAADTEHAERRITQEIPLLEGELTLRVYPGIEAGRLELTWRNPRAAQK